MLSTSSNAPVATYRIRLLPQPVPSRAVGIVFPEGVDRMSASDVAGLQNGPKPALRGGELPRRQTTFVRQIWRNLSQ
jgi:hypothetical protein